MIWLLLAPIAPIHAAGFDPIVLRSSSFVFSIEPGLLAAVEWQNKISRTSLKLSGGSELEVEVGDKPEQARKVLLKPAGPAVVSTTEDQTTLTITSEDGSLAGAISYRVDPEGGVLRKSVELTNVSPASLRVLNVVLGRYPVQAQAEGQDRGFPLYLDGQFFLSLAHPSGFARMENGQAVLRQYPGMRLAPGAKFSCMEAIYGVAKPGEARQAFVRYMRGRMRRVRRGHAKPYAVLESFGGQPSGDFWTTEEYLLAHLAKVAEGLRDGAPRFDFYCTEFWHDPAGDLTTFHRKNFPNGFQKVRDEILKLGMRPGLWIDSGGLPGWTIGNNPAVRGCFTKGEGRGELCRACEPIGSMYKTAFVHHVRENKVGLLKFDNLGTGYLPPRCDNPAHDHLPGPLYSAEAIHNAVIEFLRELDAACPEVFVILYWGYRSPWWLQYGDMYFESGTVIEAASPTEFPAPYARDSVTHRLDQAQWQITDTPWLGKDSLGVWLSDWPWNSGIGKARWQEGLIMDLGRGSVLAQVWTDTEWLSPAERRQLADFVALLKANPDCFAHARFILGNPWKNEPYGYSCAYAQKAFLAIHNACLQDSVVTLKLGPEWGLPDKDRWDVYRWYPHPARLKDRGGPLGREATIAMRPHEVMLLEVVSRGAQPSLQRVFAEAPITANFAEPSRRLETKLTMIQSPAAKAARWQVLRPLTATADKARLVVRDDNSIVASGENADGDIYTVTAQTGASPVTAVMLEALLDDSLPSRGPGRAVNGNYALVDFRILAAPVDKPGEMAEIKFGAAGADFSQTSHGGWPVGAAIDSSLTTGWSIFPQTGAAHAALFEFTQPIAFSAGAELTFKLTEGTRGHSLGRLRFSVTSDRSPSLPPAYSTIQVVAQANLPATPSGGLLLITGGSGQAPPKTTVAGQVIKLDSVWSDRSSWSCPWKAWRAEISPDRSQREFRLTLELSASERTPEIMTYLLPK